MYNTKLLVKVKICNEAPHRFDPFALRSFACSRTTQHKDDVVHGVRVPGHRS